jgi:DNA polymerase III epsilon subunit-like protein
MIDHEYYFVCDLETSGSDPIRNGIISFTLLVCNRELNIIDKFSRKVCPPDLSPMNWSLEAEKVHGYSIGEVKNHMPNDQFCYELLLFLGKYKHPSNWPRPFICHASPNGMLRFHPVTRKPMGGYEIQPWFDYAFLSWAFRKAKFHDGIEMIWSLNKVINQNNLISTVQMGRNAGHKKNNLKAWAERLNFNLNHHDDESDALCALEIYKHLSKNNGVF